MPFEPWKPSKKYATQAHKMQSIFTRPNKALRKKCSRKSSPIPNHFLPLANNLSPNSATAPPQDTLAVLIFSSTLLPHLLRRNSFILGSLNLSPYTTMAFGETSTSIPSSSLWLVKWKDISTLVVNGAIKSIDLTRIELSEVFVISVRQLVLRSRIPSPAALALFQALLTEARSSLTCVWLWGNPRMWSRMLCRKNSFSGVNGRGFNSLFAAMYQRSIRELEGCRALELFDRKDDASKTSSMSFRYVIDVMVPDKPVIVQPCSFSISSTFATVKLVCIRSQIQVGTYISAHWSHLSSNLCILLGSSRPLEYLRDRPLFSLY